MKKADKLTKCVQQAASAITIAGPHDLSDIENLQELFDEIAGCVQKISELPEPLKQQVKGATDTAGELVKDLLGEQVDDAEQSLKEVSQTIVLLQELNDQIAKGVEAEDISIDFTSLAEQQPQADSDDSSSADEQTTESPDDTSPSAAEEAAAEETTVAEPTVIGDDDIELVSDFITGSCEYIESAEAGLLEVESDPDDSEAINLVFRGFHTIKGMAGFLNLTEIGSLAHSAENLLDKSRKGELRLVGLNMDVIFESVDMLKNMISRLQAAMNDTKVVPVNPDLPALLTKLKACTESDTAQLQTHAEKASPDTRSEVKQTAQQGPAKTKQPGTDEKIKVSTSRLDNLVNMVGELVIAQSMVMQETNASLPPDHEMCRKVSNQGKMVRELQELSMMMRMVPIQGVFQKMARLIRDLCQKSGKKIDFITEGEETELDRIVVDQIGDPLVHMIRNSVDHGIESEQERTQAGKSPNGCVKLKAFHQAGNIVIEIEDDGKGLDRDKIFNKAVDNGIVTADQNLTDQEVCKLIFHAGLSTAAKVTEVSGRGVGMDVVRKNVESLRGKVEIDSNPGKGTIFTIRLPLTMAIIEGQVIRVGTEQYIIPIVSIDHSLRPTDKQISTVYGRAEVVSIHGELLPMVRLYNLFGAKPDTENATEASIVVVEEDQKKGCILVDELLGQHQVVIKSLGGTIGRVKGISGAAIMEDGRVRLILDIPGILEMAWK